MANPLPEANGYHAAMTFTLPAWGRNLLLVALYPVLHGLLLLPANVVWHPPAGLRFALMMLLPPRWWLPMVAWLALSHELVGPAGDWRGIAAFTAHFFAVSSGPWLLWRRGIHALDSINSQGWLLGAMLLSCTCNALQILCWPPAWATGMARGELFLQVTLGDFVGMILIVPLVLILLRLRPDNAQLRRWRIDIPLVVLPVLACIILVLIQAPQARSYLFAASLSLPLGIYMAFRSGWRGVALSLGAASLMIGLLAWHREDLPATVEGQLFLALAGSALLLLGTAADSLRANQRELLRRNRQLQDMTLSLREAAQRNLDISEDVRRWITSELHDELGQNLTALQTRLVLLERHVPTRGLLQPAWEILDSMRRSVSSLMSNLRPAGLEEFGLAAALEQGSIRRQLEEAGLAYHLLVEDPTARLPRLDDRTRTTLYRIVQEAATNTVRHADARHFHTRLRTKTDGTLILWVSDDGQGLPSQAPNEGIGLQGIRDRVLSRGGRLRISSDARGTRLMVRLNSQP